MKMIAYTRVSTDEQANSGLGLAAQEAAITREATHKGWDVTWMVDVGSGARLDNRPGITEALRRLAAKEADGLVVAKLDRLSRSVRDFSGTLENARRQGWALVCLDFGVDTTTPVGEMVANNMANVAQWERRVISARTKEALAAKRERGERMGAPRVATPLVVARIVALAATGIGARAIARTLTAEQIPSPRGGEVWYPSTVARILAAERRSQSPTAATTSAVA
jgi:DNA invertase Pin-like site-specific DNA recombinase